MGTTRRFQEVIYVTERAGATGNEDILSVHSDVRAQAMLQAQDLVLGFARFLGGSFAGSRAAGVSTDASGGLSSKKFGVCLETGSRSSTTISEKGASGNGPKLSKKTCVRSGVQRNDRGRLRVARLFVATRYTPICTIKRGWESQPAAERTRLERPPNDAAGPRVQPKTAFFHRSRHGRDGRGRQGARDGAVSASRRVETPSRPRCDSCISDEVVGGFFLDFEAIRTPRRS